MNERGKEFDLPPRGWAEATVGERKAIESLLEKMRVRRAQKSSEVITLNFNKEGEVCGILTQTFERF